MSPQSRNVRLTAPSWGDARRTTADDTSRTGPPGGPEKGEEEADHAEGGSRRTGNHGKTRAASAAGTEAAWRPGGGARPAGTSLQPQDHCGYRTGGGGDPVAAGVPGIWPTLASEYLSKKHAIEVSRETVRRWMMEAKLWRGRKQHVAEIHEWRPRRSRVRRAGAVGHERPRLVGGARGRDLADQHDRRCDQPVVRAICGQRLDGGKNEPAGAIREKAWAAAGLIHRQGVPVSDCGENETGWEPGGKGTGGVAADADRPGVAGGGNHLDTGAQSAGEREGGARIFDSSRPAGERHACGWSEDHGASQPLPGNRVSALGEQHAGSGASQRGRCPPAAGEAPRFGRDCQPCGTRRL